MYGLKKKKLKINHGTLPMVSYPMIFICPVCDATFCLWFSFERYYLLSDSIHRWDIDYVQVDVKDVLHRYRGHSIYV